jgi:hypothetical protein
MLVSSEKITIDASLNFYVYANPWIMNDYYEYSFNAGLKPTGFAYEINLMGKGIGKEDIVKKGIENLNKPSPTNIYSNYNMFFSKYILKILKNQI